MKIINILILLMITFSGCSKEIDISNLAVGNNGLVYEKGESSPFSGTAILKKNDKFLTLWNYKNGKANGVCKNYYENGNLKFLGEFKNGLPNGTLKEYNNDGILILEENYSNGILNGEKKEFYGNGTLKSLETYKDDFLDGPRITYNNEGKPKIKEIYKFDEVLETIIWPEN
ncbi:toxin-antitoxin system YwqK family antitoxin [Candidatus Cetobacterium colombiensis]|uniref:Toxin-antitoxin system YwqK family antitoxin n=1 Tax=Candidatus Cetobacterium colombiensis TaxID=3073100 RepID=A0ABU4WAM1_9FUSO|nr:hypothetical protein [Candidatus Cetobacterium colombiensis]MDX8336584.1 hypothetical protein [Candidatus Cetobacterium colombiensis]